MITKLDFVGVPSTDAERSRTFYIDTLGLRPDDKARFEFWVGDTCFGIWEPARRAASSRRRRTPCLALHVDDVAGARAELEAKGIAFDGRHVRHGRLPHGAVRGPRRERADAAPPLQAARMK